MPLIDLSHVVEHGMVTYPGLPGPEIGEHLSFDASAAHYAPGTEPAVSARRTPSCSTPTCSSSST